ncbi:MAG: transposase [Bacillota bacterium]
MILLRQPRLHQDEGFYHVTARGNRKEEVFLEDEDYSKYLQLVDRYRKRYGVTVHAFTLMPNHVHLLLQVGSIPLCKTMQGIQQCYTQWWNKKYGQVGHVFQGRYKASLIEDDAYLLATVRYVHLNPVDAGIVSTPEDYPWSSHRYYLGQVSDGLVDCSFVQDLLMEYGVKDIDGLSMVSENSVDPHPKPKARPAVVPPPEPLKADLSAVLAAVCGVAEVAGESIIGGARDRRCVWARRLFMYTAVRVAGHRVVDVAKFLHKGIDKVSTALRDIDESGPPIEEERWMAIVNELKVNRSIDK